MKIPKKQNKDKFIRVRITEKENEAIFLLATKNKVTKSEIIRFAIKNLVGT